MFYLFHVQSGLQHLVSVAEPGPGAGFEIPFVEVSRDNGSQRFYLMSRAVWFGIWLGPTLSSQCALTWCRGISILWK